MKVGIMGTPVDCGNRGVMALGASLVNLCCQALHGVEVVLLLGNRDSRPASIRVGGEVRSISVVHARMSLRTHPRHHLLWILLMSVIYRLVPVVAVRAAIARSTPWIKALVEAEFVGDVRGGDGFSDIYGLKGFVIGLLPVWTVLMVKGTIVQFPQTYGPYQSPLARWLARYILRRSSVIIARDRQSRKVAQDLVGPGKEVLLSPDVAFSLESVLPEHIQLDPPVTDSEFLISYAEVASTNPQSAICIPHPTPPRSSSSADPRSAFRIPHLTLYPLIGLNVNGLMVNGGYTRNNMFGLKLDYAAFLQPLVAALLREHPGELWLIPHTFAPKGDVESDNDASGRLRESLPPALRSRVRIVTAEYDQHEIKGVIGRCDFFVGSRMHACIAALSQGIPCIGVAYSMKFAGVFDSVGMGDWVVDGREATNEQAVERVLTLYRQRDAVRAGLRDRAAEARARLTEVFRELIAKAAPSAITRNAETPVVLAHHP